MALRVGASGRGAYDAVCCVVWQKVVKTQPLKRSTFNLRLQIKVEQPIQWHVRFALVGFAVSPASGVQSPELEFLPRLQRCSGYARHKEYG